MERPDYIKLFTTPEEYKPPEDLRNDTEYPNLNSKQYRIKPVNRVPKLLPFYECLAANDEKNILLACNELRGRLWDGYIWGFENVHQFGHEKEACFKMNTKSNCTNLKYLSWNIFIASQANGSLQICSTKAVNRSANYCLYKISEKFEHDGIIYGLDVFPQNKGIIVTGCSEGLLKIWDSGGADLFSVNTYRLGHSHSITSISCNPNDLLFVSCARDRNVLLWDYRLPVPAISLYRDGNVDFTSIQFDDTKDLIYLGDEAGYISKIDAKVPEKCISKFKIFDRPIKKTVINRNKMAVLGETCKFKVFNKLSETMECIYENSESRNFVRDALWIEPSELITIGWDSKLRTHLIKE